jgi:hypothetical protein
MEAVRVLREKNNLHLVVLLGGEPGLHRDMLVRLTSEIRKLDIGVRIETNAFWAKNLNAARDFLEPLFSLGASLMFSLDSFHEPFISLDNIEWAVRASDELSGRYMLETEYLQGHGSACPADARTARMIRELEKRLGRSPCCGSMFEGNILFNGRAAEKLVSKIPLAGRGVPKEKCENVPWWGDSWFDTLTLLYLYENGLISKGCGIALGNMEREPLEKIIREFDAQKHPVFSVLMSEGPFGLAKIAERSGYKIKEDYADKCHLCCEARAALKNIYPQYIFE